MSERTIAHRVFTYFEDAEDPTNAKKTVRVERIARRGETVDLSDADVKRGERFGAFVSEADEAAEESGVDFATASANEIAEYIEAETPTVQELTDIAGEDPSLAQKILDAENIATGNNPRTTLVDSLGAIAERGSQ